MNESFETIESEDLGSNMSSKTNSRYESPNIVIVPTVSFIYDKPNTNGTPSTVFNSKKKELEVPTNVVKSISNTAPSTSVPQVPQMPPDNDNLKKDNTNPINKGLKVNSWASNYLNSIGMNRTPIKMNLSISKHKILETLAKADAKIQENSVNPNESNSSKSNAYRSKNVIKINTTGSNTIGSKLVEPIAAVVPTKNYTQNIEPTLQNTNFSRNFNLTSNKRKLNDFVNPVPEYYNNFNYTNECAYTQNYFDCTYESIEKQLFEMEKDSNLNQSSRSAGINDNLPKSHDYTSNTMCNTDYYEPKQKRQMIESDMVSQSKKNTEPKRKSRFDSGSSHSDVKRYEHEKKSTKIPLKYRSDSESSFKKEKQTTKTSKSIFNYKERSYLQNIDKAKRSERYPKSSESYKRRDSSNDITKSPKYSSEKNTEVKRKSNYDKQKKSDKERYYEDKKTTLKTKPKSRTFEHEQNKRARSVSENSKTKRQTKNISPSKCVLKHSQTPEKFDLRSKLTRANQFNEKRSGTKDLDKEKTRDNLLVTINQHTNSEQKTKEAPNVKVTEKKSKGKKYKTIQFTIKVLCKEGDGSSSGAEDSDNNSGDEPVSQSDLSFLDDINVDEIVDSLKHTRRNAQKGNNSPKIIENIVKNKQDGKKCVAVAPKDENIKVKEEPNDTSQDCVILDESDVKIKQEHSDEYNRSSDCVILETVPTTKNIEKESKDSKQGNNIEQKQIRADNNESYDCIIVDPIETANLKVEKQYIDEANDCIIEPTIDKIKIETDSLEENSSKDCIIVDTTKIDATEIKKEQDTVNNDTTVDKSDDCIVVDLIEPIKTEPNDNEVENHVVSNVDVIKNKDVDDNDQLKIKEEPVKITEVEMSTINNDDVSNKTPSNVKDNQELTKVVPQDITLTALESKGINQEIIDGSINVTTDTAFCKVPEQIPDNIHSIEKATETSNDAENPINVTNGKDVTAAEIKTVQMTYDKDPKPSENHNYEETNDDDAANDSDASTVKLGYDSDNEARVTKDIVDTERPKTTEIDETKQTKEIGIHNNTSPKPQTVDANQNTFIKDVNPPINTNTSIAPTDATKTVQTMIEITTPKPTIARPLNTPKPENSPKTNPKIKTDDTEKRQVTIVKNNDDNSSEFNAIKQKLETRMFDYLNNKYTITSLIHKGRFSNIYKCNDSKNKNFSVKMIKNSETRISLGIEKENVLLALQRDIPKENINTVYMFNSFGIDRHWAFLMEYYPTDLRRVLSSEAKPFTISQVQELAGQLVTAVLVLRNNNIVHSDIKPAHILLNASMSRLKLCGFDSCHYINSVNVLPNIGTLAYRAPEVIVGYCAGFGIDIWSTAVVLYEMFTRRRLFPGVYNNTILFNQLCLFGEMPPDMIKRSVFKDNHFVGKNFVRRFGSRTTLVQNFYKTDKFYKYLFSSYNHFWGSRSKTEKANDLIKLFGFFHLLRQMLVIDPRRRLAIEFVCTDNFITNMMFT